MNWVETHGRPPKTGEKLLHLKFRNGHVSLRPYIARLIRWTHEGSEWDVTHVARAVDE